MSRYIDGSRVVYFNNMAGDLTVPGTFFAATVSSVGARVNALTTSSITGFPNVNFINTVNMKNTLNALQISTGSIVGIPTFASLPLCSVVPTTGNQLVNKTYVDNAAGSVVVISSFYTMSTGVASLGSATASTITANTMSTIGLDAGRISAYSIVGNTASTMQIWTNAMTTNYISTNSISTDRLSVSSITTRALYIDSLRPYITSQDYHFVPLFNSTSREVLYATQFAISSIINQSVRLVVDPEIQTSSLILGMDPISVRLYGSTNSLMCDGGVYPTIDSAYSLGSITKRWSEIYAASGTVNTSDRRLKKDIADISIGLEFINSLRPVQYKFIEGKKEVYTNLHGSTIINSIAGTRTHYGLIAQDVRTMMEAERLETAAMWILEDVKDPESAQGLRYTEFIAPMIKAIQDLHGMIQSHSAEMRARLSALGS
jgi:hypothetical protein